MINLDVLNEKEKKLRGKFLSFTKFYLIVELALFTLILFLLGIAGSIIFPSIQGTETIIPIVIAVGGGALIALGYLVGRYLIIKNLVYKKANIFFLYFFFIIALLYLPIQGISIFTSCGASFSISLWAGLLSLAIQSCLFFYQIKWIRLAYNMIDINQKLKLQEVKKIFTQVQ